MDTLTHAVIGACVGDAIAGKKIGKQAMLWGAIANNFPDIDVLNSLWMHQPDTFLAHRGFTHSILFAIMFTPLLARALTWMYRKKTSFTFRDALFLIGSGFFLHITTDALTVYGTGWFEPFSNYRVSFNTLFILDPLFSLPFLVAAIALLVLRSSSTKRNKWYKAAFIISGAYLLITLAIKIYVNKTVERAFEKQHLSAADYFTTPTPFNNLLWYVVQKDSSSYNVGYYCIFDKKDSINFWLFPRNDSILDKVDDKDAVYKLERFSQGYYLVENKDPLFVFSDLRFGQVGGWYIPDAPFVFSYNLFKNADNSMVLQQGRKKASSIDALKKLVDRIEGKEPSTTVNPR
jgi:inner membrane protein